MYPEGIQSHAKLELNTLHYRRYLICLLVVLVLINSIGSAFASTKGSIRVPGSYPEPNGKAAVLMDAASGRVLYSKNMNNRLPPASLTKIMTAMLVVENGDLDQNVQASKHAVETGESTIYLQVGETLTVRELLYACMLPSANDASTALAETIAGSDGTFVELMNQRASQLGMADTHFCNPHGLEKAEHYTSAYDLALLTRQAMTYPIFRQVVATKRMSLPWAGRNEPRIILNENRLLYRYKGTIGVKTGYTKKAGNCVVGAARKGDLELIAVALNSSTVYEDLQQMLDYGFTHYEMVNLQNADQISAQITVLSGKVKMVTAIPASDLLVAVKPQEKDKLSYKIVPNSKVSTPLKIGDPLGACIIYLNNKEVRRINLIAASEVPLKKHFWSSIYDDFKLLFSKVILM